MTFSCEFSNVTDYLISSFGDFTKLLPIAAKPITTTKNRIRPNGREGKCTTNLCAIRESIYVLRNQADPSESNTAKAEGTQLANFLMR